MMPSALTKKLHLLPSRSAAFVEPMECLAVAKLPDGAQWLYGSYVVRHIRFL
jgi:hypothetical protein